MLNDYISTRNYKFFLLAKQTINRRIIIIAAISIFAFESPSSINNKTDFPTLPITLKKLWCQKSAKLYLRPNTVFFRILQALYCACKILNDLSQFLSSFKDKNCENWSIPQTDGTYYQWSIILLSSRNHNKVVSCHLKPYY